jgi:hypothetical protein
MVKVLGPSMLMMKNDENTDDDDMFGDSVDLRHRFTCEFQCFFTIPGCEE